MRRTMSSVSLVVAALASATAFAQDPAMPTAEATATPAAPSDPLAKENWSTKIVDRPIAMSAGMLEVGLPVVTSLNKDAVAKPVTLPLALYYGVTNEFQLSLHHLGGLCVTGEENGCAKAYNDLGLRGTYSLMGRGSSFELAAWAQLHALTFSPDLVMQAQVGPYINWVLGGGKALILSNPGLVLGLNERETNKDGVSVPVYFYVQATDNLAPFLYTGISGAFDGFGDSFAVPAGLGIFYSFNRRFDVVAEFDFLNLTNPVGDYGAADARQLILQFSYRPL